MEDKIETGSTTKVITGTPTMVLLPAANYQFKVLGTYKITVSRAGFYKDLDPEFFTEADGEYNVYDDVSATMYLPSITKVLFGEKKYPALAPSQLFAPITLEFRETEVDITGQVLEVLKANYLAEGE